MAGALLLDQFALRMRWQSRVTHFQHIWMRRQKFGHANPIFTVLLHAQWQRLKTAIYQIAIERRDNQPIFALNEFQVVIKFCVVNNDSASHHIVMAVHVFRQRVSNNIRTQFQWTLKVWGQKCVVNSENDVISLVRMRHICDGRNITDFQTRIGWCFNPNQLTKKNQFKCIIQNRNKRIL